MLFYQTLSSPIGKLTLASDGTHLTGLYLAGQAHTKTLPKDAVLSGLPVFKETADRLSAYFGGEKPSFSDIPLAPHGTPFQRAVWAYLREIPYGKTVSYGDIAAALATSPRAVGGAVGKNPILILIPCHRVIQKDGGIGGFAAGIEIKKQLLKIESRRI